MKPLRPASLIVTVCLAAEILVAAAAAAFLVGVLRRLVGVTPGVQPPPPSFDIEAQQLLLTVLGPAVFVTTAVAFLFWFHRAHANLRAAGIEDLQHGSGWTIGGFLFPGANAFVPHQIMREVWCGSRTLAEDPRATRWSANPSAVLPAIWWTLIVLSAAFATTAGAMTLRPPSPSGEGLVAWAWLMCVVADLAAAVVTVVLVRRVTDQQDRVRGERTGSTSRLIPTQPGR